jgi:hypothetical protein
MQAGEPSLLSLPVDPYSDQPVPWTRVTPLPLGALSSRTWRGLDEAGREALLREVPDGVTPWLSSNVTAGVVHLREVVLIDGRRFGVWDALSVVSLREVLERLVGAGREVPLGFVSRVVVDAARALVAIAPRRAHGGLCDASLLIAQDGSVCVMDFGCPRPGRFTLKGAPSFVNDVFSMGAVLHASLTGFGGSYPDAVTEGLQLPSPSQLHDEGTPAVDDVVQRAISRTIEQRQTDLEMLADELEALLGEALFSAEQVAQVLAGAAPPLGPPVPDSDPGPAPGIEEVPTGEFEAPGPSVTADDLPPVQAIPLSTQPGAPAESAESGPRPDIPMATQTGVPGPSTFATPSPRVSGVVPVLTPRVSSPSRPAIAQEPAPELPLDTQPRLQVPVRASSPSRPPAALPIDTQPRLAYPHPSVEEPIEEESSTGPHDLPVDPSSDFETKLAWAQTQAHVPTPPFGVAALGGTASSAGAAEDDGLEQPEPTAIQPIPLAARTDGTPGTSEELSDIAPITDVKPAPIGPRRLIPLLVTGVFGFLVVVFAVVVGRLRADEPTPSTFSRVTPVLIVDDAGSDEPIPSVSVMVGTDGGEMNQKKEEGDDAGATASDNGLTADAGAGDEVSSSRVATVDDAGATASDAGATAFDAGVTDPEDAGQNDAGSTASDDDATSTPVNKKPMKRRRRP